MFDTYYLYSHGALSETYFILPHWLTIKTYGYYGNKLKYSKNMCIRQIYKPHSIFNNLILSSNKLLKENKQLRPKYISRELKYWLYDIVRKLDGDRVHSVTLEVIACLGRDIKIDCFEFLGDYSNYLRKYNRLEISKNMKLFMMGTGYGLNLPGNELIGYRDVCVQLILSSIFNTNNFTKIMVNLFKWLRLVEDVYVRKAIKNYLRIGIIKIDSIHFRKCLFIKLPKVVGI